MRRKGNGRSLPNPDVGHISGFNQEKYRSEAALIGVAQDRLLGPCQSPECWSGSHSGATLDYARAWPAGGCFSTELDFSVAKLKANLQEVLVFVLEGSDARHVD